MTYAVLSMPTVENLQSKYYKDGHGSNLYNKADAYAQRSGLTWGKDYKLWQPMTETEFKDAHADVLRRTVLYIDAHGQTVDESVGSTVQVPASATDTHERSYVHPEQLGLRESHLELLIAGVCDQRPRSWQKAVPPGCIVIGYSNELWDTYYRHLYERFVDLAQLLKDNRAPSSDEMKLWLKHIVGWFKAILHPNAHPPESSDWFITAGKD